MTISETIKWSLIIGSAALFILSDFFSANWGKTGSIKSLILMFLLAPFGYLLFGLLNKSTSLSISSGLVNMILLIGTILVGFFYFHDAVTTRQIIGLSFALIAIVLMN